MSASLCAWGGALAASAALLFLLPGTGSAQSLDPARFIPLALTVLKVEAATANGRMNVGTAITVAPGVAVTNCHVTRAAISVRLVKHFTGWPAIGQYVDAEHDLCFLSAPSWRGQPVTFADRDGPRLYQQVVAMGFTGGASVSVSHGEITGLHRHQGEPIIQSTSSFTSGASGGALLDDGGRLLGVLTFRLRGNRQHYFSVPAAWVAASLPIAADRFEPIGTPVTRRSFWEADPCCVPYFMRVDAFQSRAQWPELLQLAKEWSGADPDDADAWYARGVAQARLGELREAAADLAHATLLAPRHTGALFELGAAKLEAGDPVQAGFAQAALADLGSPLAEQLAALISSRRQQAGCLGCGLEHLDESRMKR